MDKYVRHTEGNCGLGLNLNGCTVDELMQELKLIKSMFPYTHYPAVGAPWIVNHCTISLEEDYDGYLSVEIQEWRKPTPNDIAKMEARAEEALQIKLSKAKREVELYKQLKLKFEGKL